MHTDHGAFAAIQLLSQEPQDFLKPASVIKFMFQFPLQLFIQIYFALMNMVVYFV
jgi:hypothetical protein